MLDFPHNVRALRIIVEELLRKIIQDSKVASYDVIYQRRKGG